MYDTLQDKINRSIQTLKHVKAEIEQLPTVQDLSNVMDILATWDYRYKEWCEEEDEREGLDVGTTYNDQHGGISMEYYIEADEMHQLSLAFRNLKLLLDERNQ